MELVRAFGIDTLVDDKVFAVFFWNKSIPAVGTAQFHGGEAAFIRREPGGADFAEELAFGTIVFVQKRLRGITAWTAAIIRNVTFTATADRADLLAIAFFKVRNQFPVSPVLTEICKERKFIRFEFLVLWGVRIIKSPLAERNVSADKRKKIANNSLLVLNVVK